MYKTRKSLGSVQEVQTHQPAFCQLNSPNLVRNCAAIFILFFFSQKVLRLPVGWTDNYKYWLTLRQRAIKHCLGDKKTCSSSCHTLPEGKEPAENTQSRGTIFIQRQFHFPALILRDSHCLLLLPVGLVCPKAQSHQGYTVQGTAQGIVMLLVFFSLKITS